MGRKAKNDKLPSAGLKVPGARDTDNSDVESIYSSVQGDYQGSLGDSDEYNDDILNVDSFGELVDNAMDKNVNTRCTALDHLIAILRRTTLPEEVEKHKATLCDIVEKNIRRTTEEALRALKLGPLLAVQLGLEIEEELDCVLNSMSALFSDPSKSEDLRSAAAEALGLTAYFGCYRPEKRGECLSALRQIWYTMKPSTNLPNLFAATLFSWTLILERCDETQIGDAIEEVQPKLCSFLASNSVDVRVAVGESLAVLYELAVQNVDEEYEFPNHAQLRSTLDEMSADYTKSHAKKDKRLQKWTFRQCIDAIFNEKAPESTVKFNKNERLELEGCHSKLLYDYLCQLLKGDLNNQLTKNEVLRELFDLGPVNVVEEQVLSKSAKNEKKNQLSNADKQRNIRRAKLRDRKAY
ncbi:unnamed protein product [Bursaphelenchus okinawaensis]|uniref:Interferon-related developmental regulator N-terminal domain-containing protein n=1 Tax=Bursaphelenchus okinawaensis TaxID=465554 RepID=A0A811KTE9_9BILA|nr:unnamed protein product [Bursaphelenchus okinawaensis]CAG9109894.1 unnamed protein product [Bursaphelenchus okinawaensis]